MGSGGKGNPVHGWLVIDKPEGITSFHAVRQARSILKAAKVGHAGTLDPMATGVLPLAFGEATKTVSYAVEGFKEYKFTICWGESRNTDDAAGVVTGASDKRPNEDEIGSVLPRFTIFIALDLNF